MPDFVIVASWLESGDGTPRGSAIIVREVDSPEVAVEHARRWNLSPVPKEAAWQTATVARVVAEEVVDRDSGGAVDPDRDRVLIDLESDDG